MTQPEVNNKVEGAIKILHCPFLKRIDPPKFSIGELVICDIAETENFAEALAVCIVTGVRLGVDHQYWVCQLTYICCVDVSIGFHTLAREMIQDDWFGHTPGEYFERPEEQIEEMRPGYLHSFLSMFPGISRRTPSPSKGKGAEEEDT